MGEGWLNCEVENGMFSDESVVVFTTSGGEQVSYFVPKSEVKDHQVKVRLLQEGGNYWVILPNEDQSIVPVSRGMVAA